MSFHDSRKLFVELTRDVVAEGLLLGVFRCSS